MADPLDRLRTLATEWALVIDAVLAAVGIQAIVYGLYNAILFQLYSTGAFPRWSGPPPHVDLPSDDRIAQFVLFAALALVVAERVRLHLAAAGVYALASLPIGLAFDLWNKALCDKGDFIAHCLDQTYATEAVLHVVAGVIAGGVYVYRGGLTLPIAAASLLAVPGAAVLPHQWRFVTEDVHGIWYGVAMLSRAVLGPLALVASALAYRRMRWRR